MVQSRHKLAARSTSSTKTNPTFPSGSSVCCILYTKDLARFPMGPYTRSIMRSCNIHRLSPHADRKTKSAQQPLLSTSAAGLVENPGRSESLTVASHWDLKEFGSSPAH